MDMKKFTTLLTMAFIALMSISFTSCDDDSDIAYTLDGTWKGNMLVEYGNYKATYSVIRFDQNDGLYSGTGYWIDYYRGNYWHGNNYIANHIRWTVRNKSIYIDFLDENSNGAIISDYALSDRKFSGYVEVPGNGNRAYFELYRDSYNWRDDYDWGYDWDYDDGWGYSKQHSGLENTQIVSRGAKDSVEYVKVADDSQKPVRRFVVK